MAYDEGLAERIREMPSATTATSSRSGCSAASASCRRGRMVAGIVGDRLMARVGPDAYADALAQPHAGVMDFTGKPMRGFVTVEPEGIAEDDDLRAWLGRCLRFVETQPPK